MLTSLVAVIRPPSSSTVSQLLAFFAGAPKVAAMSLFARVLHDAFGGFANRSFYGLNDEYSAAAEQLSHLVTVRRQGHLVTMPSNAVLTRAALGATIIGANTIL